MDIYNTCISYPTAAILLGLADVKLCFRYPRIHMDLTGAFGFKADKLCNLAMAIVFGSTASASSWEVFRRASEALTKVFANRPNLVIRHKEFIDVLRWEEIDPSSKLTPAFSCTIHPPPPPGVAPPSPPPHTIPVMLSHGSLLHGQ
jgi:hypothetical protein